MTSFNGLQNVTKGTMVLGLWQLIIKSTKFSEKADKFL